MLSSVCFIFRSIFPPHLPTNVSIYCDAGPQLIGQRLYAFAECPALLRNISKIEFKWSVWHRESGEALRLDPRVELTISAFLRNVPHMPRLHTVTFKRIKVKEEYLALLFQSKTLHHLRLFRCGLPKSVRLPPSPIRCLTLSSGSGCKHMKPLLRNCSANLEALKIVGHLPQRPTTLPLFPKLRKLRFEEENGTISHLGPVISLAPQLEHLKVYGNEHFLSRLSALPASLNRLSVWQFMINDDAFCIRPFIHLTHLHIVDYGHSSLRGSVIPTIRRIFPNITSLDLNISTVYRNVALLLARHLPNVTRLKLVIYLCGGLDLDISPYLPYFAEPRGPFASLYVSIKSASQLNMEFYKGWIIHTVLGPDPGLGGPYLKEVEMVFDNSTCSVARRTSGRGGDNLSVERKEDRMF